MAQSLHIALWGPFTNLPFGICAIYFDLQVYEEKEGIWGNPGSLPVQFVVNICCIPKIHKISIVEYVMLEVYKIFHPPMLTYQFQQGYSIIFKKQQFPGIFLICLHWPTCFPPPSPPCCFHLNSCTKRRKVAAMRQAFLGAFWPSSRCRFFVQPSVTLSMNTALVRIIPGRT